VEHLLASLEAAERDSHDDFIEGPCLSIIRKDLDTGMSIVGR
jgi:hypothetical protein